MLVPQNSTCGDDEIEIEVQATHIFNRKSVQFEILQPIFVLEKPLMAQRGLADVDRQDLGGRVCVRKDRCLIRPAASDEDVHLGLVFAIGPQHAMRDARIEPLPLSVEPRRQVSNWLRVHPTLVLSSDDIVERVARHFWRPRSMMDP